MKNEMYLSKILDNTCEITDYLEDNMNYHH